jgi:hypothetical protein
MVRSFSVIIGLVRQVEHDAGADALLQRHLLDGLRRRAARRRPVVPRCIDVRRRVHAHFGDGVVRPADEVLWEEARGKAQYPDEQLRRLVPLVADAHLHEAGIAGVELDRLR